MHKDIRLEQIFNTSSSVCTETQDTLNARKCIKFQRQQETEVMKNVKIMDINYFKVLQF